MVALKYILTDNSIRNISTEYSMGSKFQVILWVHMGAKKEKWHPFHTLIKCSSLTTVGTYGHKPVQKKRWTVQRVTPLEVARISSLVT